jgi:hypothetical protein
MTIYQKSNNRKGHTCTDAWHYFRSAPLVLALLVIYVTIIYFWSKHGHGSAINTKLLAYCLLADVTACFKYLNWKPTYKACAKGCSEITNPK